MSGAALRCCPVCGARIKPDRTYLDHTLMESTEDCKECGFYNYEYTTGNSHETIGFVTVNSYYYPGELTASLYIAQQRDEERRGLLEEARRFWNWPDAVAFRAGFPENELIVADWLDDHGFGVQATGVRKGSSP